MKRKRLDRTGEMGWGFEGMPYYQTRVDTEDFHGLACVIQLTETGRYDVEKYEYITIDESEIKYQYWDWAIAGKLPVCGKGMTWLQLIPDGKKHVITVKYKPDNTVSLWYVDIIENIEYDSDGVAVFIDKYLDVVFTPQGDMMIDDIPEIEETYQSGGITKDQYYTAFAECVSVVAGLCTDSIQVKKTEIMCGKILAYVNERIAKGEIKQYHSV
jgi:predicted RNA-binding protein associated with RNAse of E/G family